MTWRKPMLKKTMMAVKLAAVTVAVVTVGICEQAAAHCDTLDGPVVRDARKALAAKDVTPTLKWVRVEDEERV
jgi:hypothetical protein